MDNKPFGLKEITLVSMDDLTTVILPAALELGYEEILVTGEFYGNDDLQGVVSQPLGIKGAFKQGGYPMAAIALMTGHTFTETGTTPNQVATINADSTSYPYFQVFGRSLGDEGDDVHIHIYKAKLTSALKGTFKRAEFFMLDSEFTGVKVNGEPYEVVAHETAVATHAGGS